MVVWAAQELEKGSDHLYWLEVAVTSDGEAAEAVAEFLRPFAHDEGVVVEHLGDQTSLDPEALLPDVTVKIYLSGDVDSPHLRRRIEEGLYHLGRLYPIPPPTFRELADEDWATAWRQHYRPLRIGQRFWIRPSWIGEPQPRADDLVIVLDPGMAFGTGTHPTTRLCLEALEDLLRPGQRVLDVGTGSGILAIGAVKLGAASVIALDVDGVAARATVENAARNNVSSQVGVLNGRLDAVSPDSWDVVVVNILAPVITHLLAHGRLLDYLKPGGWLILSGIIDEQVQEVLAVLAKNGGQHQQIRTQGDWVCLVAGRQQKTP